MIFELDLYISKSVKKAYFHNYLMNENNISKIIHNHKYAEIHMIFGGDAEILVGGEKIVCTSGTACIIPSEEYHCYLSINPKVQTFAFQIDMHFSEFKIQKFPESIISEIFNILKNERFNYNCGCLEALLSYVTSAFSENISAETSKDYAIAIYDFISKNYNRNATLAELAQKLSFSEKQTERLIKKYMNCTFKKALVNYKMVVADFLEKNTDMTKTEIANYVGYANYSGYLKAKKTFTSPVAVRKKSHKTQKNG